MIILNLLFFLWSSLKWLFWIYSFSSVPLLNDYSESTIFLLILSVMIIMKMLLCSSIWILFWSTVIAWLFFPPFFDLLLPLMIIPINRLTLALSLFLSLISCFQKYNAYWTLFYYSTSVFGTSTKETDILSQQYCIGSDPLITAVLPLHTVNHLVLKLCCPPSTHCKPSNAKVVLSSLYTL